MQSDMQTNQKNETELQLRNSELGRGELREEPMGTESSSGKLISRERCPINSTGIPGINLFLIPELIDAQACFSDL